MCLESSAGSTNNLLFLVFVAVFVSCYLLFFPCFCHTILQSFPTKPEKLPKNSGTDTGYRVRNVPLQVAVQLECMPQLPSKQMQPVELR